MLYSSDWDPPTRTERFIRAITSPQRRFNRWRYRPPNVRKFYASETKARNKNRYKQKQNEQSQGSHNSDDELMEQRRKQIEAIVSKRNNPSRSSASRV